MNDDNNNSTTAVESDFYYWNGPDPSPDLQPIFLRNVDVTFNSILAVWQLPLSLRILNHSFRIFSPSCEVVSCPYFITQRHIRVVSPPVSCSGGPCFKSRHGSRLSWQSVQASAERVHHDGSLSLIFRIISSSLFTTNLNIRSHVQSNGLSDSTIGKEFLNTARKYYLLKKDFLKLE